MPRPKSEFDDLRSLEFREPAEVLEPDAMYTIYEVGRLLQGLDPDAELDVETENVLLDWAIPWMIAHSEAFVFAEPEAESDPGYYGLTPDGDANVNANADAGERES
jgi:hypothetical protein